MLHQMGKVESPSCRKRSVGKETSVHILYVWHKVEEKNQWQSPDGTGSDKRGEAEWHRGPG